MNARTAHACALRCAYFALQNMQASGEAFEHYEDDADGDKVVDAFQKLVDRMYERAEDARVSLGFEWASGVSARVR